MDHPGSHTATRSPASDAPAPDDPSAAGLTDYLANRDAPCPGCGYNLRGTATTRCPECGASLELELRRRRPLAGWGPFLLLAFGWLLLAGSLNTARNIRDLIQTQQQTAMTQTRMTAARAQLQFQAQLLQQQQTAAAGSLAGPSDDSPASVMTKLMRQRAQLQVQAMQSAMQPSLQAQLAATFPPAQPVPTFAQVWLVQGWKARVGSVCFATLALCGFLGLLLLLISRIRPWPESRVRILAAAAGLLFTLYAGWHITLFVSEFR